MVTNVWHIRNINPIIWHKAKMAALKRKMSMGVWLSEAMAEHLKRGK